MKKLCILLSILIFKSGIVYASDNFFNEDWWKTATVEDVKAEIANGADVNAKDKLTEQSVLTFAAQFNQNPEIMKVLINAGADVNNGFIDVTETVQKPEVIRVLLDAGADVNTQEVYGFTPLISAVGNNNLEIIQMLIDAGANVNARLYNDWTALITAVASNANLEIIQALIDAGADVNVKDNYGLSALMVAVKMNKNFEVIKLLIDAGADVNAKDNEGNTALSIAKQHNASPEIIKLLTGKNTNFLDVNWWKTATLEDVKTEIANGADVNAKVEYGKMRIMPILGIAIAKFFNNQNSNNDENYKIIELLIDAGADVNAEILSGVIPMSLLTYTLSSTENDESIKVLEKLINSGANVNAQSGMRFAETSPLMLALIENKDIEIIKTLIDAGADVNAFSKGILGTTALMVAAQGKNSEITQMLIDAGADVNAKATVRDISSLMRDIPDNLTSYEKKELIKIIEDTENNGKEIIGATPLIIAAENSNPEIIRILIDAGADTSLKSADNKTALDIAKEKNGNPEVIEILEHHQEFDEMFAECYSTQNIGNYANKFCKCAIKSAINALGPADKEKAKDAFDDARAGTFKNLIQKGKSAAFNECY